MCHSGVRLVYLPPYSPDFNPIEEMFSAFKAHIRRNNRDFRTVLGTKNKALLVLHLYNALNDVATLRPVQGGSTSTCYHKQRQCTRDTGEVYFQPHQTSWIAFK